MAGPTNLCQKLCPRLWHLPTIQDKPYTFSSGLYTHGGRTSHTPICTFFDGPHHGSPLADGYDSILVVVDQGLSKGVILSPCNKTITSEDTAKLLLEALYKRIGLPDKIITDRATQFASKAFIELLKLLGIKSALSTAYHPQTDGTTERVNQEIEIGRAHV